ncbi:hypothetical protein CLV98_1313 [Dyadobacter jejuensis]|uniref:Uncharacterized protein n=1 Tax=Dyadobacter jejuensis TaxID=1082580 RepID=A0A316A5P5_9BACT|nr:hypothetical protein CLV98_1313 [Dyadobacter jejuensis]
MARLSLDELKTLKASQVMENLEAIRGGELNNCHQVPVGDRPGTLKQDQNPKHHN